MFIAAANQSKKFTPHWADRYDWFAQSHYTTTATNGTQTHNLLVASRKPYQLSNHATKKQNKMYTVIFHKYHQLTCHLPQGFWFMQVQWVQSTTLAFLDFRCHFKHRIRPTAYIHIQHTQVYFCYKHYVANLLMVFPASSSPISNRRSVVPRT